MCPPRGLLYTEGNMAAPQHKSIPQRFLALDAAQAERDLADLIAAYPELAEDEMLRRDMIEGSTNAFELLNRIVMRERDANAMEASIGAIIKDLQTRKGRFERLKEAMRSLAFKVMKAGDLPKVELPIATISISRRAGGVKIVDADSIPPRFQRVVREPDKVAIKAALEAGKKVRGAELGEPVESLNVRAV